METNQEHPPRTTTFSSYEKFVKKMARIIDIVIHTGSPTTILIYGCVRIGTLKLLVFKYHNDAIVSNNSGIVTLYIV